LLRAYNDREAAPMKEKRRDRASREAALSESLGELGEFRLIRELVAELGDAAAADLSPEGDDAALWEPGGKVLATTDALFEGVHFRPEWTSPEDLGFKAISVNVSDIAAMGGEPSLAMIAVGVSPSAKASWLRRLYGGVASACRHYGMKVAGGDTFAAGSIVIAVTVLGKPPASGAVGRGGAAQGDLLFVTGVLGEAAAALTYLKARQLEGRLKGKTRKAGLGALEKAMSGALSRFRRPVARVIEGRAAAAAGASAMIDISDGLAGDALHVAEMSGVGVVLRKELIPVGEGGRVVETLLGEDPYRLALRGGEDYELLIAVPPDRLEGLREAVEAAGGRVYQVGQVVGSSRGCILEGDGAAVELSELGGFDHFSSE